MNTAFTVPSPDSRALYCPFYENCCLSSVCAITLTHSGTEQSSTGSVCHAEYNGHQTEAFQRTLTHLSMTDTPYPSATKYPTHNFHPSLLKHMHFLTHFWTKVHVLLQECFPHCNSYFIFNLPLAHEHMSSYGGNSCTVQRDFWTIWSTQYPVKEVPTQALVRSQGTSDTSSWFSLDLVWPEGVHVPLTCVLPPGEMLLSMPV